MTLDFNCSDTRLTALNNIKDYITNNIKSSKPVGKAADYGNEEIFSKTDESFADFQARMDSNTTLRDTFNAQFGSTDDLFNFFDENMDGTLSSDEASKFYDLAANSTDSFTDAAALTNQVSKYEKTDGTTTTPNDNKMGLSPDAQIDFIESLGITNLSIEDYEVTDDGSYVFTTASGTKLTCAFDDETKGYKVNMTYTDGAKDEAIYDADKKLVSEHYKDEDTDRKDIFGDVNGVRKVISSYYYDPKDKSCDKDPIGYSEYNEDSGEMERLY